MSLRRIYAAFLALSLAAPAHAGTVRLLNGETFDGDVQFNANQIIIVAKGGAKNTVDIAQVLDATFRDSKNVQGGTIMPGVMLINGSVIAGPVNTVTDPIRVGGNNTPVPLASAAWIVFLPMERDKISQPSSGQTGVILPTGEFFPGAIASTKDNRVAINSALFGPQRFSIQGRPEISALVLHDVQDNGARYHVSTTNGSSYAVSDIHIEGDNLVIGDPGFNTLKINKGEISDIHLSKSQYVALAAIKPDRVDPPKGTDPATAVQVPENSEDIQTAVNTAVTYSVPKGFLNFVVAVSVPNIPQGAPATARFTFSVYGDGRFRLNTATAAMAPGDNPQRIVVPVSNYHTITIRVEPASIGATGYGQWIEPMFLKQ